MGTKHNVRHIRFDDNLLDRLDELCRSYDLDRSKMARMAIWEMPTKEEKTHYEKKTEELETNFYLINQEHVRLRTFILAMGNFIRKLEKENGAPENSYLEQMVKDYPVLYDYAVQMTVGNAELN